MGNLLAAITATAQTRIAELRGGDFAFGMSVWIGIVAVVLALLVWLGPEARGVGFGKAAKDTAR
jgi:SHS family lactate transporter-like MFS transporter